MINREKEKEMYYLKHPGMAMSALSRSLFGDDKQTITKTKRLDLVQTPVSLTQESGERLAIRVVASCLEKQGPKQYQVRLSVEVMDVYKSATGLEKGDVIMITYEQDYRHQERLSATGNKKHYLSFPSALKSGDTRVAYLDVAPGNWGKVTGRVYQPSAYQHSFTFIDAGEHSRVAAAS